MNGILCVMTTSNNVTFDMFVVTLATTTAVHLGDVADRESGVKSAPNLASAAQMIDMLALLEDKTRGNLTLDEEQKLSLTLRTLRKRLLEIKEQVVN